MRLSSETKSMDFFVEGRGRSSAFLRPLPGFDAVGWTVICAPSATPKPVIDRLHAELKAAAATPEVRDLIARIGTIPVDSPPPTELQKFLASEIDRWGSLIQRAGLAKTE